MKTRVLVAMAALSPFATALAQAGGAGASASAPRVQTANGAVAGITLASGIRTFRGIPFAAPPVRENRWRPPQPAQNWQGVRPADRFADQCMQARVFGDMMFRNAGISEDCLYLNVWIARKRAAKDAGLPVLVYFYGGGFVAGDGSEPRYDGESMAKRGIVVVTMSYRLGVFGFFSHPELTAESPNRASGNYALMDQTAALPLGARQHRGVRRRSASRHHRRRVGGLVRGERADGVAALEGPDRRRDRRERRVVLERPTRRATRAETEQNGVKFAADAGARRRSPRCARCRPPSCSRRRAVPACRASVRTSTAASSPTAAGQHLRRGPAGEGAAARRLELRGERSARALLQEPPTPENAARGVRRDCSASARPKPRSCGRPARRRRRCSR